LNVLNSSGVSGCCSKSLGHCARWLHTMILTPRWSEIFHRLLPLREVTQALGSRNGSLPVHLSRAADGASRGLVLATGR
jgi:hypothetical protein